jgi:hypothetical protein
LDFMMEKGTRRDEASPAAVKASSRSWMPRM